MIQHKWCKAEDKYLAKVDQGNFLLHQLPPRLSFAHLFMRMIKCEHHCGICVKSHLVWKFFLDSGGPFDINLPNQTFRRIYGAIRCTAPKTRDPTSVTQVQYAPKNVQNGDPVWSEMGTQVRVVVKLSETSYFFQMFFFHLEVIWKRKVFKVLVFLLLFFWSN